MEFYLAPNYPMPLERLKQFLSEKQVAMRWDGDDCLYAWIHVVDIVEFKGMFNTLEPIPAYILDNGLIWVNLEPIADKYGIDPELLLKPE